MNRVQFARTMQYDPEHPWYWVVLSDDNVVIATGGGFGSHEATKIAFDEAVRAMNEISFELVAERQAQTAVDDILGPWKFGAQ